MYKRIANISLFIIPILIICIVVIAAVKDKAEFKWFFAVGASYCLYWLLFKLFSDVLREDKTNINNPITISISTFLVCSIINLSISYSHTEMLIVAGENKKDCTYKKLREGEVFYIENDNGLKDSIVIDTKYDYIYNKSDFDLEYYKVYYSSHYYNRNEDYTHIIKPNKIFKIKEKLNFILESPPMTIMVKGKGDNQYRTGIIKKQINSSEINNN